MRRIGGGACGGGGGGVRGDCKSSTYGTVSAKIAPRLKCYKNASRLNRYNFPTDNAIDFLVSTLHSEMV